MASTFDRVCTYFHESCTLQIKNTIDITCYAMLFNNRVGKITSKGVDPTKTRAIEPKHNMRHSVVSMQKSDQLRVDKYKRVNPPHRPYC